MVGQLSAVSYQLSAFSEQRSVVTANFRRCGSGRQDKGLDDHAGLEPRGYQSEPKTCGWS